MRPIKKIPSLLVPFALYLVSFLNIGCIYKFHDISVSPNVKTVKVSFIENHAQYVNPQLSPKLTDKLRQKIVSQTRLSQTNGDNADWEIGGWVTSYSLSTSAISNQRETNNRLTVTVHITKYDRKADTTEQFDISRSIEFPASQSLQQAETAQGDELIRTLTDEIFNRLFSNW